MDFIDRLGGEEKKRKNSEEKTAQHKIAHAFSFLLLAPLAFLSKYDYWVREGCITTR
jgi:hypothetical protein